MNILNLGLGSIGQRHLRNLKELDKRINIFAYRKKFNTPALNNNNKVLNSNLKKKYNISYIKNLSEIKKLKINCAFICTPSSHHAKEASFLIKNNISCFIEKPVETVKYIEKPVYITEYKEVEKIVERPVYKETVREVPVEKVVEKIVY